MKLEATLLTFVRAHREGSYDLYVDSLQKLAEVFFAFDHYHYARWVPIHVEVVLYVPRTKTKTLGPREFYYASSAVWNSLPLTCVIPDSRSTPLEQN